MGLVIDLGLERFEPLHAIRILETLVTKQYTTCVREVFGSRVVELSSAAQPGSEPAVRSRWLPDKDARRIVRDLEKLPGYASFSWGELEALGVTVQDLAIVRDGPARQIYDRVELDGQTLKVIDLDSSASNFRGTRGNIGLAAKLHALAKKHRLIVHSA